MQAIFSLPPDIRLSRKQIFDQLKAFDWMGAFLSGTGATCLIFALSYVIIPLKQYTVYANITV